MMISLEIIFATNDFDLNFIQLFSHEITITHDRHANHQNYRY